MLDISSKRQGDTSIVSISGELDHHTAANAREELSKIIEDESIKNMVIDLSKLSFMDSSGIGVFIGRYKVLSKRNGIMAAYGLSGHIRKIWELSGLYKIIEIYEDLQDSLDGVWGVE